MCRTRSNYYVGAGLRPCLTKRKKSRGKIIYSVLLDAIPAATISYFFHKSKHFWI